MNGTGGKLQCKPCETGFKSRGVKCETCEAGHVALPGKHYSVWRKDKLPEGFTANCVGDCAVKVCKKNLDAMDFHRRNLFLNHNFFHHL